MIESVFPCLDTESLLERRFDHLLHLDIILVEVDVVQNIFVRDDAQRAENDTDRDVLFDVRKRC